MAEKDEVSATGSCVRCGSALDLASVKRNGVWYCREACADGLASGAPEAGAKESLINRPRRAFRRRPPRELKRAAS